MDVTSVKLGIDSLRGVANTGRLSTIMEINLPAATAEAIKIPKDETGAFASWFAFAYPLDGIHAAVEKEKPRLLMSDPHVSFVLVGGFVYMDEHKKVIGINALAPGVGK